MSNFGTHLAITTVICKDGEDASAQGYDYTKWQPQPTPLNIEKIVVIREGTQEGRPTIDFIMEDQNGNKYCFMITRRLLDMIPG